MTRDVLTSLLLISAASVAAPMIASRIKRWLLVPNVVLELLAGILIGPYVLKIAKVEDPIEMLSELGLALLMFMAGYEIDFGRIKGRPMRRALLGWLVSFALGLAVGFLLAQGRPGWLVIGMALSTTALGTILPIVRDAGLLDTGFGAKILANGAVGEFGPIIAIALLLGSDQPLHTLLFLLAFAALGVGAAILAAQPRPEPLRRLLSATLGTSVQLAVRLSLLTIIAMLALTEFLSLDILLGAFVSGIVVRLAIGTIKREEAEIVESKLDAIAFGFLVPLYFVVSGMKFDLHALLTSWYAAIAMLVFIPAFLLVRGTPVWAFNRQGCPPRERRSLTLLTATALPLVVAITDQGVEQKAIDSGVAAALVGAAMVTVLLFPMLALRMLEKHAPHPHPTAPRP